MNSMLIKLAAKLALEPDNFKKILKWVSFGILFLLFLPSIMLMTISVLFGNGSISGDFDLTKTELFGQINPIYEDYMTEIENEMNAEANRIIEENTTTDVDPETGEETSECDVKRMSGGGSVGRYSESTGCHISQSRSQGGRKTWQDKWNSSTIEDDGNNCIQSQNRHGHDERSVFHKYPGFLRSPDRC